MKSTQALPHGYRLRWKQNRPETGLRATTRRGYKLTDANGTQFASKFCACGCEMPLAEALRERKNGYLNNEQAEALMPVRMGSVRTNAEAALLELRADRIERGEHVKEDAHG